MRGGLLGVLLFFSLEALIFRSHWYERFLEPDSSAGEVVYHLRWLKDNRPPTGWKEVAVIGDSRVAEGFSGKTASELPGPAQNYFWSFGLHGSTPRVWYYFLRTADPKRRQFAAIVLALDHYSDEDTYDSQSDRIGDLNYVIPLLSLSDTWTFSQSLTTPARRRQALAGSTLKGWALRRDVQAFLPNIPARLQKVREARTRGYGFEWGYEGVDKSLEAPSETSAAAPQTGELTTYRKLWFDKTLAWYRGSATKLIFVQLPRGNLAPRDPGIPSRALDSVRGQQNVIIIPAETFQDLEAPQYFFDGMHLNRTGRGIFSERLAVIVDRELSAR
jgi:hypothetical protein